jgi:hypothetical protein
MINDKHTNNSYEIRREIEKCYNNEQIENILKSFSKLCTNIKELTPRDFVECAIQLINSLPTMNEVIALKIVTYLYSILEYLPEYELHHILGINNTYGESKYKLLDFLVYPSIKKKIKMFIEYSKLQKQDK